MKQMDALQKLEQYVNMPSGSADLEGLAAFVSVVEKDMQALGFTVTRHPMAGRGDALECVYGDGEEMGFAREVGDRVLFMDEGIIMEQGTPAEVFGNPQNPRTQDFLKKVL